MSPANVTWTGNGHTMTLDQETQSLTGYYPLVLVPVYEADTDTWGLIIAQARTPPRCGWRHHP